MWKGVDKIRTNLEKVNNKILIFKFRAYFTAKKDDNKNSEEILEKFVEYELENFNFKKKYFVLFYKSSKREKSLA